MSHAEQLIEIATELAVDVKGEVATLQRRLAELENRKLEIEARLDAAKYALQRLSSFVSVRGTEFQCPRCWILNEAIASLRPIDGETKDQDSFRCIVCESEFGLRS
jgi:hypothetical protein